jgi:hypothetical protein
VDRLQTEKDILSELARSSTPKNFEDKSASIIENDILEEDVVISDFFHPMILKMILFSVKIT